MWDSFDLKLPNKYALRRGENLMIPAARTTRAKNSFDFRAAMAWNHLPERIKSAENMKMFIDRLSTRIIYCECKNCN